MTTSTDYLTDDEFRAYLTLAARDAAEFRPFPCATPGCDGTAYVHPDTLRDDGFDADAVRCDSCYRAERVGATTPDANTPNDKDGS